MRRTQLNKDDQIQFADFRFQRLFGSGLGVIGD